MIIAEIQSRILSIEQDAAIYKEINFDSRAEAIDFIDFYIIDGIEGLLQKTAMKKELIMLKQRAEKIKDDLEKIDTNLFKQLREKIRTGIYIKSYFKEIIRKYLPDYFSTPGEREKIGYDNPDIFINGLLSDQAIPETTTDKEPEMVFYQKTPARIIFEMAELAEIKQEDVFFDIGSGLGQVPILVNLLSGTKSIGIEYDPAYYNYAQTCALDLNLSNVEFINTDALKADYSKGTIFFLYTPFEGSTLQSVLEILQKESQKRAIRIFTYGPCSTHVATQRWLNCVNGPADNHYKLYEFRSFHV